MSDKMGNKIKLLLVILILQLVVGFVPTTLTVFALELNDDKYNINFVIDGTDSVYETMQVNAYSDTLVGNFPASVRNLRKTGYAFIGWSESKGGATISSVHVDTADKTVYAKWQAVEYSITYIINMANVVNTSNLTKYTIEYNDITLSAPACTGYNFLGWFTTPSFDENTRVTIIDTAMCDNITLYAKWGKGVYNITYHMFGGENSILNISTYDVDTKVMFDNPIKVGHIFDGWYIDKEYTTKITQIPKGSEGDVDVYAKWTPREYTVLFKLPDDTTRIVQNVEYGSDVKVPNLNNAFYEIPVYSRSLNNITGDTIISVSFVNIILVYVAGVLLAIVVIFLLVLNHIKKKNTIKETRRKYREKVDKIKDKYRWY